VWDLTAHSLSSFKAQRAQRFFLLLIEHFRYAEYASEENVHTLETSPMPPGLYYYKLTES
jgi:hypothetical protein